MTDPRRARRLLAVVVLAVIAIDQIAKALAVHFLAHKGILHVLGPVHVTLYRNFAGSGNRLTGHPVIVSSLSIAAVILIAAVAVQIRSRVNAIAAGLLLGGGVSNLLDRLLRAPGPLRGGVVDWLKPTLHGGTMNLADVAITAGVALFVLATLVSMVRDRRSRDATGRTPPAPGRNPVSMTDLAQSRTLVKSAPELWTECSEAATLARHLGAFGAIRVTRLEPETTVAWEGDAARGTVSLEPSGWGTRVTLTARTDAPAASDPLTEALDSLGAAHQRPFSRP